MKPSIDDPVFLHQVARLFFEEKLDVKQVKEALRREYSELSPQMIYRALGRLADRNIVTYMPRLEDGLREEIERLFDIRLGVVHVVDLPESVPIQAAEVALSVLEAERSRSRADKLVGLALGPGSTTRDFAHLVGARLAKLPSLRLRLFALAAGAPALNPEISPISFFNYFPKQLVPERIGLFAPNLVQAGQFAAIRNSPGVREAFERKKDIFLYVTSMGNANDEHDWLAQFLRAQSKKAAGQVKRMNYAGNVQYRPYDSKGPIQEKASDYRAVTLVELDELVQLAKSRHNEVILMAANKKPQAMIPLLTTLRVFSKIVMDTATACNVIEAYKKGK